MESVFEWIARLAPAGIVLKAIAVSVAGISILLIFVTARRGWRAHYFARRERQVFYTRQHWNELVSGTIPASTWRFDRLACEVMETTLLDSIEVSDAEELPRLVRCLRRSGLIDSRIEEARMAEGWQRWRALVALGRTRAPEALPALAEALDSHDLETRIAAVRGMGKLAIPEAAVPMLNRFCNGLLLAPWPVLKNAVLNCCAAKPGVLLLYLFNATGVQREMRRAAATSPGKQRSAASSHPCAPGKHSQYSITPADCRSGRCCPGDGASTPDDPKNRGCCYRPNNR